MRMQSSVSVETDGFPNSQLVKLTVEWSLQSNSPSVFLSFSPIQSSSEVPAVKNVPHVNQRKTFYTVNIMFYKLKLMTL